MLFPAAPFLVSWREDETVFSLASRLHRLWGHPLAETTARILFGAPHGGTQHDLTTHLSAFSRSTDGLLGDAGDVACERTLACYYRTFLAVPQRDWLTGALCGTSLAHVKFRLGILTSRFRAHHPLKACPECMREAIGQAGVAWWRLTHQFPGVWVCPLHRIPLRESLLKSSGVGRFQWHLPDERDFRSWPMEKQELPVESMDALSSLADTIVGVVQASREQPLDIGRVLKCYRSMVSERGWLTQGGSLRLHDVAESFAAYAKRLSVVPELDFLPESMSDVEGQIGRLLRPMRSGTHPIRYFLMIDWLFGGKKAFFERYAQQGDRSEDEQAPEPFVPASLSRDIPSQKLRQLLVDERLSLRETAKRLGVDINTAMVWAARCNIEVSRRPKQLKSEPRKVLVASLKQGVDKVMAAKQCDISVASVTRVLRTEPGLQMAWHRARFERAQAGARQAWLALITQQGELGVKYLRELLPATYAWLYRNDRAWLNSQAIAKVNRKIACTSPVRWDERDFVLSSAVEDAALAILKARPGKIIHLWQLYQQVPELKAKLSALGRLPLTRRAIDRAVRANANPGDLLRERGER